METARLDKEIAHEQRVWATQEKLVFYQQNRCEPKDLYETEQYFLPDIVQKVNSVLDVGCAAGGFYQIMKHFNPSIKYVGVDITSELISIAKRKYPQGEFMEGDGIHFTTAPESFDLVYSSGMLHLNSRHGDIVRSMWAQARHYLLCDFRLTFEKPEVGQMDFCSGPQKERSAILPYHVLNVSQLLSSLAALSPRPTCIRAKGYRHAVSPQAHLSTQEVLMAFFLIEKGRTEKLRMGIEFNV